MLALILSIFLSLSLKKIDKKTKLLILFEKPKEFELKEPISEPKEKKINLLVNKFLELKELLSELNLLKILFLKIKETLSELKELTESVREDYEDMKKERDLKELQKTRRRKIINIIFTIFLLGIIIFYYMPSIALSEPATALAVASNFADATNLQNEQMVITHNYYNYYLFADYRGMPEKFHKTYLTYGLKWFKLNESMILESLPGIDLKDYSFFLYMVMKHSFLILLAAKKPTMFY